MTPRTYPRRRRVAGVGVLLAGCLLLVGCQVADQQPASGAPTPTHVAGGRSAGGRPVSIEIPAVGVDASVVPVGLLADRTMEVPAVDQAGWYEPGPRPGEAGPAVIVGHVDSRRGPAVFFRLQELRPGDRIVVGLDGGAARSFLVERVERQPKEDLPVGRIWNRTDRPVLRLITCGGSFDRGSGHYRDNVIVDATATWHCHITLSQYRPMEEPRWTLDELAERVDAALAVDYPGQSSGRVRDVPDRRAIRWYTTIGLVDRPVAHHGRTALYGPRHLLQLVAIKRLQARGLSLVAIQQELAGATDTHLTRVARVPMAAAPVPLLSADGGARSTKAPARPAARAAARGMAAFWRQQPAAAAGATDPLRAVAAGPAEDAGSPSVLAAAGPADGAPDHAVAGGITSLRGVRLGDGATLLLEPGRDLDAADLQAILDAAGPLLDALRARGLDGPPGPNDPRREHR